MARKPDYPAWYSGFMRGWLTWRGWTIDDQVPDVPKFVAIGAPHTTNWDGIMMFVVTSALGIRMLWLGKHTLFRFPFGPLMRLSGGVPVNRATTKNAVEQVAAAFHSRERMALIIAPEGTRKKSSHWKTGFYYMALRAGVPIVLGYVDYPNKRVGLGATLYPTGDIEADFDKIRAFYAGKRGKYPENESVIAVPPKENTSPT